jgi:hypothetical protein
MEPLTRFGRVSAPWFQAQVSDLWSARTHPFPGQGASGFPRPPSLSTGRFNLAAPRPRPNLRHCFRSLCAGVARPRARCARHPCLVSGRVRAPWSSAQVPAGSRAQCLRTTHTHPEWRRLSSSTTLESRRPRFHLAVLRAPWALRRFSCCAASRMLRSACYPCCCSPAELPDTQPRSGSRRSPAFSGFQAT